MLPGALDLSSLFPLVLTAIALVLGSILVVKKAASKYFVVDASFETGEAFGGGSRGHHRMSIGGGGDATCAACGRSGTKKCSRCKRVRYCSTQCQSRHWEADHKSKCKLLKSSNKVDNVPSGDDAYQRRKFSISLVPARGSCKVLQEPKKILFPYDEFVKLFNWDKPGFPPCGLLNCRNSCFANVVLQCLAFTRPLAAYLLEKDHNRACIRKQEDWCFLCELQDHVQRASQSQQPFSPINILSRIPNIGGNLGYGSQEDAHEFMRFAIDTMQSVCLDEHGGEKAVDPSTQETTLIQHIFGGHLQSQVKCTKCDTISNRYENMMDLTVEIHGDAASLEECLDQFTVRECLDGDNMYKCDGCNSYVKAWKRLTVHQAPNILTIALKRFQSGRFGKLNKRVTFPEELDLSPYMSEDGDGTNLYSLYAVVVHVDMLNASFFGHYICYTKDYYGCWYRIDDCKVTSVDVEEVLSQGAYMLLYSRRTARREPFIKPIEPARKKPMASRDIGVSNVPNGVNVSNDFASFPSSMCSESNNDLASLSSNTGSESNLSLLRDTGHVRLTDAKTDTIMKGKEDLESEVSLEVTPSLVHKDLGDVDMIDSEICSFRPKGCEKESSNQPSHVQQDVIAVSQSDGYSFSTATPPSAEVRQIDFRQMDFEVPNGCEGESSRQLSHLREDAIAVPQTDTNFFVPATLPFAEIQYMECEEPLGISDANSRTKDNGSVCTNGEVPRLSGYLADGFISGQNPASNSIHNMDVTSSNALFSSSPSTESENSGVSKPVPVMAVHHPSGAANGVDKLGNIPCRNEGNKTLPPVSENGSFGKPKPLFSRGFLDKSTGEKSANHEKIARSVKQKAAAANIANGYANGQSKINNDANGPTLELTSERGKNSSDPGVAFIRRGSLNGLYRESAAELKIGKAKCRVPAEVASGSEAASSKENSSTSNNVTACNKGNGCRAYKKDATSRVDEDEYSNGGSDCPPEVVNGTCYPDKHVTYAESNGLAANYVEGKCCNGE